MIGKIIAEGLGDVAFVAAFSKAWSWANQLYAMFNKHESSNAEKEDELKKLVLDSKSWDDEGFFALDLAESGLDDNKKKMIQDAMIRAKNADDANGTTFMRNFRMIVTFRDINTDTKGTPEIPAVAAVPGTPFIPAAGGKPAVPTTPGTPGKAAIPAKPGDIRPGVTILKDLGESCVNADEFYLRITALGMMQDSSSNLEKFVKFCKKEAWPAFKDPLDNSIKTVQGEIDKRSAQLKKRSCDFRENRPWWGRFLNS